MDAYQGTCERVSIPVEEGIEVKKVEEIKWNNGIYKCVQLYLIYGTSECHASASGSIGARKFFQIPQVKLLSMKPGITLNGNVKEQVCMYSL